TPEPDTRDALRDEETQPMNKRPPGERTKLIRLPVLLAALTLLAACGAEPLPTLDGNMPLVVAHRGASGYLPEVTLEAYTNAVGGGVAAQPVISTKHGVMIARHNPELSISLDVASPPEFDSRKRSTMVDGADMSGWFAVDFTLGEIKTLGAIMTTDPTRPQQY